MWIRKISAHGSVAKRFSFHLQSIRTSFIRMLLRRSRTLLCHLLRNRTFSRFLDWHTRNASIRLSRLQRRFLSKIFSSFTDQKIPRKMSLSRLGQDIRIFIFLPCRIMTSFRASSRGRSRASLSREMKTSEWWRSRVWRVVYQLLRSTKADIVKVWFTGRQAFSCLFMMTLWSRAIYEMRLLGWRLRSLHHSTHDASRKQKNSHSNNFEKNFSQRFNITLHSVSLLRWKHRTLFSFLLFLEIFYLPPW